MMIGEGKKSKIKNQNAKLQESEVRSQKSEFDVDGLKSFGIIGHKFHRFR